MDYGIILPILLQLSRYPHRQYCDPSHLVIMKQHRFKFLAAGLIGLLAIWYLFPTAANTYIDIIVQPRMGEFVVSVTTTGELRAKESTKIYGPSSAREAGIWDTKVTRIIPEGTVVEEGEFVAELDRSAVDSKIRDAMLAIQKSESMFVQAQLDCTLTLSNARDELINLRYVMEERQLAREQAAYEAPSIQRQAEIDYQRAERNLEQAIKNYDTKVRQAEAKMSEVGADLTKEKQKMDMFQRIMSEFTVVAPKSGMLVYHRMFGGQKVAVGSNVSMWDPVVGTLPNLNVMESITYVNEVDIQKIKPGQSAKINLDAVSDKSLNGVVTQVANIGETRPNSDSKVFEVILEVSDRDTTLRPAMTTSNQIIAAIVTSALSVPLEAIHARDSLNYVFKKLGTGVIRQQVEVGMINENEAEIKRGLTLEDNIFLSMPADTTGLKFVGLEPTVAAAQRNR
jgi:hypothetical protein